MPCVTPVPFNTLNPLLSTHLNSDESILLSKIRLPSFIKSEIGVSASVAYASFLINTLPLFTMMSLPAFVVI